MRKVKWCLLAVLVLQFGCVILPHHATSPKSPPIEDRTATYLDECEAIWLSELHREPVETEFAWCVADLQKGIDAEEIVKVVRHSEAWAEEHTKPHHVLVPKNGELEAHDGR